MARVVVLGGGWSGLLAAIRAKTLYPAAEVICIDRDFSGGLLRSEVVNGYLFDVGGSHVVFSGRRDVVEGILSLGGEWVSRERASFVLLDGIFVPYPFENGIYVLPPEKRARYGLSLIRALTEQRVERPRNFREWLLRTFGREMAEDYLIPYNEKIWKRPLDQISADWVYIPGRLPLPSLEDIVKAVAGIPTVGYKENALFHYPKRGGIIKQWEAAYRHARALGVGFLKDEVKKVKMVSGGYIVNGRLRADRIVNTLPLKEAPQIFDLSEEAFKAAEKLDYNSVVVTGLGLRRPAPKQHWVYVPDKQAIFHRYAWVSNYGEDSLPGRAALIAEVTLPPRCSLDLDKVKAEVVRGFEELDIAREEEVEVVAVWFHRYGYPVYTLTHSQDVAMLEAALTEMHVETFGRWGNWQYWNTDRIFEESQKLKL
jgi:protoporphyrinogen oxidase